MDISNYKKLSRKKLLETFELERQEWLALGMDEETIDRIHFGKPGDKERGGDGGRGGDYGVWLSERRHTRADHKYAPGAPVAVDAVDPDNAWISGGRGGLDEAEAKLDLERALETLTGLQRRCFVEVRINGLTQAEAADAIGVSRESVKQAISGAVKKLKKYF